MMRRAMASVLMLSMFQLNVLEVRAVCERHAAAAVQDAAISTVPAEHAHHAGHAPSKAPPPEAGGDPGPKCCMMAGTCNAGTFATIVRVADPSTDEDGTSTAPVVSIPRSVSQAPEPPPPKA